LAIIVLSCFSFSFGSFCLWEFAWKKLNLVISIPALCRFHLELISLPEYLGTAVAQWLRCCATNRKVVGSIPPSVSGFFIDVKSFRSHCGPGVDSASNRNECQEHFLGVKAAGAWGWQPYHHPVPSSWNLGKLTSWNPLGHSRPVTGLLYLYQNIYCVHDFTVTPPPPFFFFFKIIFCPPN